MGHIGLFLTLGYCSCINIINSYVHSLELGKNENVVSKTVQGEEITAALDGDKVVITDAKGGKSTVTATDIKNSNGVIHVIDTVLMPAK